MGRDRGIDGKAYGGKGKQARVAILDDGGEARPGLVYRGAAQ